MGKARTCSNYKCTNKKLNYHEVAPLLPPLNFQCWKNTPRSIFSVEV